MNILIVEDSATLRHSMCRSITKAGHTPLIAESGERALQTFDSETVDMVIMDIEMPGLDGFETTRIMRDWLQQEGLWLPIIFVTGKNEEDDLRKGIEVGGDDYLIKPVSETILIAKIRAMERILGMRNELKRLNEHLVVLSERDSLTHLYNRRTFDDRADEIWKLAARDNDSLAILIMDIDHFKLYNDCYGHLAGDECIQKVAETIKNSLNRPGDLLARYGGEEFIAMLPNTNEEGAHHVAERLRRNVSNLNIAHKESTTANHVTLSVGGAVVSHTAGTQLKNQIHAADQALYTSKQQGRNRVTVKLFSPRIKVLIADKEGAVAHLVDGKLKQYFALLQARSSQETLALAAHHRPDVIVLHENLATDGGLNLAKSLRRNPDTTLIPLVVISNKNRDAWCGEAGGIEAEACLTEDGATERLVSTLNRLLF